jgi:hypothetical protein
MSLRLKREQLERIVYEELQRFLAEQFLNEAPPGRGTVLDDEVPEPEDAPEEQLPTTSPAPEAGDDVELPDQELPTGEEPVDADLDADVAGDETGAEEGSVAADLEGKTIESVSMEEESKIMPGATEVVITFRESPDALRLLIGKAGKIKVFYKGLHNDFTSPMEQIPGEDDEMELGPEGEEELPGDEGGEELEDVPPLGPSDFGDEETPPEEEPV